MVKTIDDLISEAVNHGNLLEKKFFFIHMLPVYPLVTCIRSSGLTASPQNFAIEQQKAVSWCALHKVEGLYNIAAVSLFLY